jgi:acyl transferase domain-containing protein/NAD(P)-dependent dehydrogenase (short-subunit alcohol dehydrogenase family)/acyl carrier protein
MSGEQSNDRRDLLRRAYTVIKDLERRLELAERAGAEPIAIVGVDCRFPGGANGPDKYWRLLRDGRDAIQPFPADRGGLDGPVWHGGFLDSIDQFDPAFFGITPREARVMDPQHRILLETAWTALEDAGEAPDGLSGSRTGVFVGATMTEYKRLIDETAPDLSDVYLATGNALNAAAGRLSFVLGLQGPCMTIDTACSSSLVAVHVACRSLQTRDSDLALAGGVNVIVFPKWTQMAASWGLMAADGRCKTFDARADGFVRAEGCGLIVLRRLSDARARGDRILAVIAGSAVNQDGRSSGLTVPNGVAQQALIRSALADAGLTAADIEYVEAHGTGTSLGDPIEIEALAGALGGGRPANRPLLVGSAKTNIGHAEAASGIAGLIKVLLSLEHGTIPANLHFQQPNPAIPWHLAPLQVVTRPTPWRAKPGHQRAAGVSSFGLSGTNAHVILRDPPEVERIGEPAHTSRPVQVLTLSARHPDSLRELAQAYVQRLETADEPALADMCYTTNVGRAHLPERLAIPARSPRDAGAALAGWLNDRVTSRVFRGTARPSRPPRIAFLFTGQGSQYLAMGRQLYNASPCVREAFDRCAAALSGHMDRPLLDVMFGSDAGLIDNTAYAQPALFVLEYALAALWKSWGVVPTAVLGHSVGELAAATVADAMSLEDGLRLVAARGRLMQALPRTGAMAAVFADAATVTSAMNECRDRVAIAAINGPQHVVISGDADAISAILADLADRGVSHVKLRVSHAFHSPLLDPMLDDLEAAARTVQSRPLSCELISNVTGAPVKGALSPSYWRQQARQPVQFLAAIRQLPALGIDLALELGPAPTLTGLVERSDSAGQLIPIASMRQTEDEWTTVCEAVSALYVHGAHFDWSAFHAETPRRRVPLPTTTFRRSRYWFEAGAERHARPTTTSEVGRYPLVGPSVTLAATPRCTVWQREISLAQFPYLADHRVRGNAVVPATAYVEMVTEAIADRFGVRSVAFRDLRFTSALLLEPEGRAIVQVTLQGSVDDLRFSIHSRPAGQSDDRFVENATGCVAALHDGAPAAGQQCEEARRRCSTALAPETFYAQSAGNGNDWGPTFQGMRELWIGTDEACAVIEPPTGVAEELERYLVHPALADAFGHALAAAVMSDARAGAFVAQDAGELRLYRPARGAAFTVWARVESRPSRNEVRGNLTVLDAQGQVIAQTLGATMHLVERPGHTSANNDWWYGVDWEPSSHIVDTETPTPAHALVVCGDREVGEAVAARLRAAGMTADTAGASPLGRAGVIARADADAMIDSFRREAGVRPGHVLFIADSRQAEPDTVEAVEEAVVASCGSVLHLAQALTGTGGGGKLWVVTRQGVSIAEEVVSLEHAPLWGLGRSLSAECGTAWGGLIDLPRGERPDDVGRAIAAALRAEGSENQLAVRNGWYVPRLARRTVPEAHGGFAADPDGAYLITGGLGGLGLVVAQWLARCGARHLVLAGRRPVPPPEQWETIPADDTFAPAVAVLRALELDGVSVSLPVADMSVPGDVTGLLERLSAGSVPLRGIVHAAGIERTIPIKDQTVHTLRDVLAPKLRGGWMLARECGTDVQNLVLFSSASAIFGPPFLCGYAAANAFLDALAVSSRATAADLSRGGARQVVSINWGRWGEVGMAVRSEARMGHASMLTSALSPDQGVAALGRALTSGLTQIAVVPIDWSTWRSHERLAAASFYSRMIGPRKTAPAPTQPVGRQEPTVASAKGNGDGRALFAQFERVMELAAGSLNPDQPLMAMGLDSLMAVELRASIEASYGVDVPLERLLGGATAEDILRDVENARGGGAVAETAVAVEEGEL